MLLLKFYFHVIIEFVYDLCMLCVDVHADHLGVALVCSDFPPKKNCSAGTF